MVAAEGMSIAGEIPQTGNTNTRVSFGENVKRKGDYFISPKGVSRIVKNGAKIIGGGINQAFGICYF